MRVIALRNADRRGTFASWVNAVGVFAAVKTIGTLATVRARADCAAGWDETGIVEVAQTQRAIQANWTVVAEHRAGWDASPLNAWQAKSNPALGRRRLAIGSLVAERAAVQLRVVRRCRSKVAASQALVAPIEAVKRRVVQPLTTLSFRDLILNGQAAGLPIAADGAFLCRIHAVLRHSVARNMLNVGHAVLDAKFVGVQDDAFGVDPIDFAAVDARPVGAEVDGVEPFLGRIDGGRFWIGPVDGAGENPGRRLPKSVDPDLGFGKDAAVAQIPSLWTEFDVGIIRSLKVVGNRPAGADDVEDVDPTRERGPRGRCTVATGVASCFGD